MASITSAYYSLFKPILKQLGTCTEAYLFAKHIATIMGKLPSILDKYANKEEYRVFPLGCVAQPGHEQLIEILRIPFLQLLSELEAII